ncbi:MAG: hypothetical protein L3J10_02240 [Sulfurimonas sp.]|nr:hypothetical protein [Sulfurimonas sp.]
METELIIKFIMGLVALLAVLLLLLFIETDKEKKTSNQATNTEVRSIRKEISQELHTIKLENLESLVRVIKDKQSDASKLSEILDLIIKYHGRVHKKLGLRAHPDFNIYVNILFTICRHPNANKDLIIKFERELQELNGEYKQEINDAITKGLNSRRV